MYLRILMSLMAVATLSGCGRGCAKTQEKVTETMLENAIQQASKSAGEEVEGVDIKIAEGEFRLTTSEGSFELGGNLTLPENFPKTVPVYKGAEVVQLSQMESGASIVMKSDDERSAIVSFYKSTLEGGGWLSKANAELPTGNMMQYEMGTTNLSVFIADVQGECMITIALIEM